MCRETSAKIFDEYIGKETCGENIFEENICKPPIRTIKQAKNSIEWMRRLKTNCRSYLIGGVG